jgi:Cytochrome c554 and c-prime
MLTKAELMDPAACQGCHPSQYQDWSGSMHAYAAEDPVFLAMNQRGQRETAGALGDFCVKCHAPVALREGLTTDGLNLTQLPPRAKGVTCYFCHSVSSVGDLEAHNNPLMLATDGSLFGPFPDPVAGTPHVSTYSALFDLARPESAAACGSCHDIVNGHGAAIERTYREWQTSLFADPMAGQTCIRCHMDPVEGPASTTSTNRIRSLRTHTLAAVDVAVTPFPEADIQRHSVQTLLDGALSGTVCLTDDLRIDVTLDNVGAGHSIPSGATSDRRLWIEIVATAAGQVIYQTGTVPAGQTLANIVDPDLWLVRDCLFDDSHASVDMFWAATTVGPFNLIPAGIRQNVNDPTSFTRSHVKTVFPVSGPLSTRPDRITLKVFLKPIGDDVLQDLVASGDLDPAIADQVPRLNPQGLLAAIAEWTPAKVNPAILDSQTRRPVVGLSCVTTPGNTYYALPTLAASHARCEFAQP